MIFGYTPDNFKQQQQSSFSINRPSALDKWKYLKTQPRPKMYGPNILTVVIFSLENQQITFLWQFEASDLSLPLIIISCLQMPSAHM